MTHRQFLAWQEWLRIDVNRPGKTEWQLARLTAEVRMHRTGKAVNPNDCLAKVEFGEGDSAKEEAKKVGTDLRTGRPKRWPVTDEELAARSKAKAIQATRLAGMTPAQQLEEKKRMIAELRRQREEREAKVKAELAERGENEPKGG